MKNVTNLAKQYADEHSLYPFNIMVEKAYIDGFQKCDEFIDMTLLKHLMNKEIIIRTHKGSTYFGKFLVKHDNVIFRPDLTNGYEDIKYEYVKEWKYVTNEK